MRAFQWKGERRKWLRSIWEWSRISKEGSAHDSSWFAAAPAPSESDSGDGEQERWRWSQMLGRSRSELIDFERLRKRPFVEHMRGKKKCEGSGFKAGTCHALKTSHRRCVRHLIF